jgi:hypothetical protein
MKLDGFKHAATIHSELFALNNGRRSWNAQTVVIVDEAAMIDTKLMAIGRARKARPARNWSSNGPRTAPKSQG